MQSLSQQASSYGICIAYQGVIPSASADTVQVMRDMVTALLTTQVTTIVVFSSKTILSGFFPFVLERNITDKVWIGTEDWSVATLISGISRINTIGTVIGVSIKKVAIPGFEEFEKKVVKASMQQTKKNTNVSMSNGNDCLQSTDLYSLARNNYTLEDYDITSSFNVYKAVYALAHALHSTLGCDAGKCNKMSIYPWEVS